VLLAYPNFDSHQAWVFASLVNLQGKSLPILDSQSWITDNYPIPSQVQPSLNVLLENLQLNESQVEYLGQDAHINHPSLPTVEVFSSQQVKYYIDPKAGLVAMIDASLAYLPLPNPEELPLEQLAIRFIGELAPSVDLDKLTKNHGEKGGISFFRWEDPKHAFIQVGLTENDELVTFINGIY